MSVNDIQDETLVLQEITDISNEIIELRAKKKNIDYIEDIFPKNYRILTEFNKFSLITRLKIKIALDCEYLGVDEFNLGPETNFGVAIYTILMSWINISLGNGVMLIECPVSYKTNIENFIFGTKEYKQDKLGKICEHTSESSSKQIEDAMPLKGKIWAARINSLINNFARQIIQDKCKMQYAYRKLCLEKKLENYLTFIKTNNWIFSQYDVKRRCFSQNKQKQKFKECIGPKTKIRFYAQNANSNILKEITHYIINFNINGIKSIQNNTKFNVETILSWFRNQFPKEYYDTYKFVFKQIAEIKKINYSIDNWEIDQTNFDIIKWRIAKINNLTYD